MFSKDIVELITRKEIELAEKEAELKRREEQVNKILSTPKVGKAGRPKSQLTEDEKRIRRNQQQQEYNKSNPDKYKETWKKTTEKNKEKIRERARLLYHKKKLLNMKEELNTNNVELQNLLIN